MNISEKEQLTINNEANKILNEYFSMLNHKDVVRRKINELLHVNPTKPLTVALVMGPDPYAYYCQRILVEMHQFLDENGLFKE